MTKGLVIIGYQGIGKSSLAGWNKCIDLESGNFFVEGERAENWYIPYCQTALSIADQGYKVFVSSHKEVRDYLKNAALPKNVALVAVICPMRTLRNEWIARLQARYDRSGLEKDYRALMNAVERFEENIDELCCCGLPVVQLWSTTYDLKDYINLINDGPKEG